MKNAAKVLLTIGKLSEPGLVVCYVSLFSLSLVGGLMCRNIDPKLTVQCYELSTLFLVMSVAHDRLFKYTASSSKK
jgi:hypothetical protein